MNKCMDKTGREYEHRKQHTSIERKAEEVMKKAQNDIEFPMGSQRTCFENHAERRAEYGTLMKTMNDKTKRNNAESLKNKTLRREITSI